jgi:hypothetical protein
MGIEPTGWTLGSADPGATAALTAVAVNSVREAANAAASLPMADQPNGCAAGRPAVFNVVVLSLAEISDRLEIQQLLVDYAAAIDQRRFDDLDRVFTADAYIDYRAMGGIDGVYPEIKAWLAQVLPNFPAYSHLVGNFDIRLAGDTAAGRTMCFNPMKLDDGRILFCALWYEDEFVRTPDGWRMTRRVESKCMDKLL